MSLTTGRPGVLFDRTGKRNAGSGDIMSVNGRVVEVEHVTKTISIPITTAQSSPSVENFAVDQVVTALASMLLESGLVRVEKTENLSKARIDYRGMIFVERGAILAPPVSADPIQSPTATKENTTVEIKHEQDERPSKGPSLESLLGSED